MLLCGCHCVGNRCDCRRGCGSRPTFGLRSANRSDRCRQSCRPMSLEDSRANSYRVCTLHEAMEKRVASGHPLTNESIQAAVIEGGGASPSAETHDGHGSLGQPGAHSLGERQRRRRDEAHCRTDCWRNDHVNDHRSNSGASFLRADKKAGPSARYLVTCRLLAIILYGDMLPASSFLDPLPPEPPQP